MGVGVSETQDRIYQRYLFAGMTRDARALADLFTPDGILEAPLVPADHPFPTRLRGRTEIREGLAAFHRRPQPDNDRQVNVDRSRYVLHSTSDPDVFIVEIDAAFDGPDGATTMSLVQIFRLRAGLIAHLRDYFAPHEVG
jgi:hypothetical protein